MFKVMWNCSTCALTMWCSVDSWHLIAIPLPGNVTVELPLDFARDKAGGRAEHMLCKHKPG